jgi:hypothetical protein
VIIRQARLTKIYDAVRAAGKKYPLKLNLKGFERGAKQPIVADNFWCGVGMPLPGEVASRLAILQKELAAVLPGKQSFYFNPVDKLHITLFSLPVSYSTADKMFSLPGLLKPLGPLSFYSEEVMLAGDGWIIACWQPQDYFEQIQQMVGDTKERIVHTTIGGLLKNVSLAEHQQLLKVVSEFNQEPLGLATFDQVKILHETRHYLAGVREISQVDLAEKID